MGRQVPSLKRSIPPPPALSAGVSSSRLPKEPGPPHKLKKHGAKAHKTANWGRTLGEPSYPSHLTPMGCPGTMLLGHYLFSLSHLSLPGSRLDIADGSHPAGEEARPQQTANMDRLVSAPLSEFSMSQPAFHRGPNLKLLSVRSHLAMWLWSPSPYWQPSR